MRVPVIGFVPPIEGVDAEFNTFRLGGTLAKKLTVDQEIFLMDEKAKEVIGRATVRRVETGKLGELCLLHASANHRELNHPEPNDAPKRLFEYLQKLYGPHIAKHDKKACVVYLRRIE